MWSSIKWVFKAKFSLRQKTKVFHTCISNEYCKFWCLWLLCNSSFIHAVKGQNILMAILSLFLKYTACFLWYYFRFQLSNMTNLNCISYNSSHVFLWYDVQGLNIFHSLFFPDHPFLHHEFCFSRYYWHFQRFPVFFYIGPFLFKRSSKALLNKKLLFGNIFKIYWNGQMTNFWYLRYFQSLQHFLQNKPGPSDRKAKVANSKKLEIILYLNLIRK